MGSEMCIRDRFEHTLVITDDGNEILTIPDEQYAAGQLMLGS